MITAAGSPLASPTALTVIDINRDGIPDLILANPTELVSQVGRFGNNVSVLWGKGDGTFQAPLNYEAGMNPGLLAVDDFNGDGLTDVVAVSRTANTVSVLLTDRQGQLRLAMSYVVGASPQSVVAGDFNGDGKVDLAVSFSVTSTTPTTVISTNGISLLLGIGDGTFQAVVSPKYSNIGIGPLPAIATGDVNRDGRTDLAVVFQNAPTQRFPGGAGVCACPPGVALLIGADGTPTFSPAAVVNSASYGSGGVVAPGEIIAVFGSGLGPVPSASLQIDSKGNVSSSVAGVQVLFDGIPSPLIFAAFGQLGAIVPYRVSGRASTQMQVSYQGLSSIPVALTVAPALPGIFTSDASGHGQAAVVNQDGTLNSPDIPALIGSYISIYGTGDGQTFPAGIDGKLGGTPPSLTLQQVSATIGGLSAPVQYAGGVAGLVAGVFQMNLQIPQGVKPGGAVALVVKIGNGLSAPVMIAVRPNQ